MDRSIRHPDAPAGKERKYARPELERRFLFAGIPVGVVARRVLIEDRYLDRTRLRLRRMTDLEADDRPAGGEPTYKLAQKIPAPDGSPGLITNVYLSKAEYDVLVEVPARTLRKVRLSVPPLGVDVFSDQLSGLILAEAEFEDDDERLSFVPPSWVVAEVTHDERMTGGSLARLGAEGLTSLLREYGVAGP